MCEAAAGPTEDVAPREAPEDEDGGAAVVADASVGAVEDDGTRAGGAEDEVEEAADKLAAGVAAVAVSPMPWGSIAAISSRRRSAAASASEFAEMYW